MQNYTCYIDETIVFQIDILETGFIENVKLIISIDTEEQPREPRCCEHLDRIDKKDGIYSVFVYHSIDDFFKTPCTGYFQFKYNINGAGSYYTDKNFFSILNGSREEEE